MLVNPPRFELGLIVGIEQAVLSVTLPTGFHACSFDKVVHFVRSDKSDFFFRHPRTFLMM